mmetsp:Transcript_112406/g.350288  ORF Transcript_112406/g.350288 Transcript_112406/m.350288 type:complete len:266 (+) Transcript_112406:266-1063(+)
MVTSSPERIALAANTYRASSCSMATAFGLQAWLIREVKWYTRETSRAFSLTALVRKIPPKVPADLASISSSPMPCKIMPPTSMTNAALPPSGCERRMWPRRPANSLRQSCGLSMQTQTPGLNAGPPGKLSAKAKKASCISGASCSNALARANRSRTSSTYNSLMTRISDVLPPDAECSSTTSCLIASVPRTVKSGTSPHTRSPGANGRSAKSPVPSPLGAGRAGQGPPTPAALSTRGKPLATAAATAAKSGSGGAASPLQSGHTP